MTAPDHSPAYRRYVLGLLIVVYAVNFIDRQILGTLVEPIKRDLGASDTELGFLTGFAFALFYTIAGLPIARWADVGVRRSIIALGVAVWSGLTALSALAQTFWQLAAARVGVGIGEAALNPPAHSLLTDYFPRERRATALSIYSTGIFIGILFAYILGGRLGATIGWRYTLVAVGAPGLALALLVRFTIREPERALPPDEGSPRSPFLTVVRDLWSIPAFPYACLGAGAASLSGYALSIWTFAFFERVHGTPRADLGVALGLAFGIGGATGAFLGGWLTDRFGGGRWLLTLPAVTAALTPPAAIAYLYAPGPIAPWLVGIYAVFSAMYLGPVFSTVQTLAPPHTRATAAAVLLFVLNIIGYGIGPWLTGALADHAYTDVGPNGLQPALATVSVVCWVAAALFWIGSRKLRMP